MLNYWCNIIILFVSVLLILTIQPANSVCNICQETTQVACISPTSFLRCQGNKIIPGTPVDCPAGTYCNSDFAQRCIVGSPSCGQFCGVCNLNSYAACISRTQFAYCFGNPPRISTQIESCGTGEICYADDPAICFNTNSRPVEPTCSADGTPPTTQPSTETPTSTSLPPINDAQSFCLSMGYQGRYSKPNDASCRSYYYCHFIGNNMNGQEFVCPGSTYFNCATRMCTTTCNKNCALRQLIADDAAKNRTLVSGTTTPSV